MNIEKIKNWWKTETKKDIPKGWDSNEEECLDYMTRDSYAAGYNEARKRYAWVSVKDKDIILPSKSSTILVTDGNNYSLIKVSKFVDEVDKPFNRWTHWMKIPNID